MSTPMNFPVGQEDYRRRFWDSNSPEDALSNLRVRYDEWKSRCKAVEEMFFKHIYDQHATPTQSDFRQHRAHLHGMLMAGEFLLTDADSVEHGGVQTIKKAVQAKIDVLFKTLLEWHLPPGFKDEFPDSLNESFRQAADGKLEPLEI